MSDRHTPKGGAWTSDFQDEPRDYPLNFGVKAPEDLIRATGVPLSTNKQRNRAVNSILTSAVEASDQGRDVSYSRTKGFYTGKQRYFGKAFTYANILAAVEDCKKAGLIIENRAPALSFTGRQSTFAATPDLVSAFDELATPIGPDIVELIRLVDEEKNLIDYKETDKTQRWRRELRDINKTLAAVAFTLPDGATVTPRYIRVRTAAGKTLFLPRHMIDSPSVYRQFNRSSFSLGGRAYGGFWQSLPKDLRAGLLMDGEPVASVDFAELHPRMLYAERGKALQGSAYDLDGYDRDAVKLAFLIAINAENGRTASLSAFCNKTGWVRADASRLLAALEKKHAPVADGFYSGAGLRFMRADSEILVRSIRDASKAGFAALPIHDEVLVPVKNADKAQEIMVDNFAVRFPTASVCPVKVSSPAVRHMPNQSFPSSSSFPLPLPVPLAGGRMAFCSPEAPKTAPPLPKPGPVGQSTQLSLLLPIPGRCAAKSDYAGGIMPAEVVAASRETRRTLGLTQDAMAGMLGISRPQLANAERQRFGLGREAAGKLKALIARGEQAAA